VVTLCFVNDPLTVLREARRTRRPLGRVINELIDHALRMRRFPGIVLVEGPVGPVAHVAGTGLDVWEIVALVRAYGSVDRVLEAFPHLPAPAVHTALAYAEEYREEIILVHPRTIPDEDLGGQIEALGRLLASTPEDGLKSLTIFLSVASRAGNRVG